ncbi:cytochrome c peroxidase [Saprospira sp. CCB-QB6]|uniref:cytochrome-c peroxidase n=1 Tax=Saprospira sp. CCB-QB6 TaxID=3023936 RepID=UPI00234A39B5|nr:cytochrome c peroxidase [Saprospira sp. CCB-QB6]WCL81985.1 cytochrome c peroxidase [Saprospira sp. CCB-QB6]
MKILSLSSLALVALFFFLPKAPEVQPIPLTPALPTNAAELGERLFFDSILSLDRTISCASCHIPEYAFADTSALSKGVGGTLGDRNTPSAMNMLSRDIFFWDGRAATLAEQALGPIENPVEMNLPLDSAIARLLADEYYAAAFAALYPEEGLTKENLGLAIAAYEETLETGSAYDQFADGDSSAISASAMRGIEIFNVKGKCFDCHFGPDMTGDEFKNIGTYNGQQFNDVGRFSETKDSNDLGKFKVPGLRNVAVTAPYMHDGSFKTLREVIEYYNRPDAFRPHAIGRDTLLREPLGLTEQEMDDLEAFMRSLTAPQFVHLLAEKED